LTLTDLFTKGTLYLWTKIAITRN